MSESKENDNGRYFEYLITKNLKDMFNIALTERASKDQERDQYKKEGISPKVLQQMEKSIPKIISWIASKIDLNSNCILDRLPDKSVSGTHDDISIINGNDSIAFSLKHNHDSIYHGRTFTIFEWFGFEKKSPEAQDFLNNVAPINKQLKIDIKPGIRFSIDKVILDEYQSIWSNYVKSIYSEMAKFVNYFSRDSIRVQNLFKTIVGQGTDSYRVLKKATSSIIIIQDIRSLKLPSKVEASLDQKEGKKPWIWYLVLKFDNGMVIEARSKQDKTYLKEKALPPLKPDWKVVNWGKSGMVEDKF